MPDDQQYTTPTEYFDAWHAEWRERFDRANLVRYFAFETPYARHARRLHEAANKEVRRLVQMGETQ